MSATLIRALQRTRPTHLVLKQSKAATLNHLQVLAGGMIIQARVLDLRKKKSTGDQGLAASV
jgi:hypothetical protein